MTTSSSTNAQSGSNTGPQQRQQQRRSVQWFWLLLWTILLGGAANVALWAMVWLTRIPPVPNCEQVTTASVWRDRLYCTKALIKAGSAEELAQAVALATDWPQPNSSYDEAQTLLETASAKLLVIATDIAQDGDLERAVALASKIPLGTPLRQSAQGQIYSWQQEWQTGSTLEEKIQTAISARDWNQAQQHIQALQTLKLDYWLRDRRGYWRQRLQREQTAWTQLQEARDLAEAGSLEGLRQGLEIARQVDLSSGAWQQAKQDVDRWSHQLVDYALDQWRRGRTRQAIAIAQELPPHSDYAPPMQDLMRFSHAQKLAQQATADSPEYTPSYGDLFALMEAIQAGRQVTPESAFYQEVQRQIRSWQAQLQDLIRLQSAQTVANVGQEATYRLAIAQAQQVVRGRPRRLQGQTLIAHWRNEIERIQDRPILTAADRLAQSGTIPALQDAIATASQVELGRALRIEAQTRIAAWRREIEVIEDRPILTEANALASDNQLSEAIKVARQVQPGRALYERAQDLIGRWTTDIQIAEDKPILDEAKDLAYGGSLTRAINLAAQIAPGRALYDEAQNAIAIWKAEREYIWSIREAEANRNDSEDSDAEAEDSSESQ